MNASSQSASQPVSQSASLTVIVPCHNEQATISQLLKNLRLELPLSQIIVIDDGSSDDSALLVTKLTDELKLEFLSHSSRRGKGAAFQTGLVAAKNKWLVMQDADLEYDPADLKKLLSIAVDSDNLAVYGSRYLKHGRSKFGARANYIAVQLFSWLCWVLYGRSIYDPHTCYKMVKTVFLRQLRLKSNGFETCAELNSKLLGAGIDIKEVPISYNPRSLAQGKKIRFKDFFITSKCYIVQWLFQENLCVPNTERCPQLSSDFYLFVRVVIGILLTSTGFGKILFPEFVVIFDRYIFGTQSVATLGFLEAFLGIVCLSLIVHRLLWLTLVVLFSSFLTFLAVSYCLGQQNCSCLGTNTSIPLIAVIDVSILGALFKSRSNWWQPSFIRSERLFELISNLKFAIPAVMVGISLTFGSVNSFAGFLRGENLTVDAENKYAGEVLENQTSEIVFHILNQSGTSQKITSATTSCNCTSVLGLPLELTAGESKPITLTIIGRIPGRIQHEMVSLFVENSAWRLKLHASVFVRSNIQQPRTQVVLKGL